jgi:hypothetical protein
MVFLDRVLLKKEKKIQTGCDVHAVVEISTLTRYFVKQQKKTFGLQKIFGQNFFCFFL